MRDRDAALDAEFGMDDAILRIGDPGARHRVDETPLAVLRDQRSPLAGDEGDVAMPAVEQIARGIERRLIIVDMDVGQAGQIGADRLEPDHHGQAGEIIQLHEPAAERRGRAEQDHAHHLPRHQQIDEAAMSLLLRAGFHQDDGIAVAQHAADAVEDVGKDAAADLMDRHQYDVRSAPAEALGEEVRAEAGLLDHLADASEGLAVDLLGIVDAARYGGVRNARQPGDLDDRGFGQGNTPETCGAAGDGAPARIPQAGTPPAPVGAGGGICLRASRRPSRGRSRLPGRGGRSRPVPRP